MEKKENAAHLEQHKKPEVNLITPSIPDELKTLHQWIVWKFEWSKKYQKYTKVLYQLNGKKADSTDSNTWTTFDLAVGAIRAGKGDGIGFVFSKDDLYCGIDLDKADEWPEDVKRIIQTLNSYTEVSPSGKGYHVIVKANKPGARCRKAHFEMYDQDRFFTVTGNHVKETPLSIESRQQEVNSLYESIFNKRKKSVKQKRVSSSPDLSDEEIIIKASKAKNGMKFDLLLAGEWEQFYTSQSEADLALVNMIAFFTQDFNQIDRIFSNSGLYREKWDREDIKRSTIQKAIDGLTDTYKPGISGEKFNLYIVDDETNPQQIVIPLPFSIEDNALFKTVIKNDVEQKLMVSRMAPIILKELTNVERNSVHYEISWKDRGREKREVVAASAISTKKDLLTLADSGLPCNDLNYKDLIRFFDQYLACNRLDQSYMVERLGHIQNSFIHPLDSQGVEIIPNDIGERQVLEAFQIGGTVEAWKTEVFDRVKHHRKVLFLVLASFASILLHDLKVNPFIVDLSGSTSQGKTTALQVARSVWGNEGLINEWNATKVAIERKAGFLNSFPLYLDDTRKADERIIQSVVYQFSGGRSKGRGSLKGSQREMTWNNILISTGELSLADYASKAGGAAARVIPLVDQPFEDVEDNYFAELYEAIESNYGAVGMEFLKKWQAEKKDLIPEFHKFKEHYLKKSKGNEVLTRLSMYFSAVHFAGSVARKSLNLEMDLKLLDRLFDEIAGENKALDKPKEMLEEILLHLDSSRKEIYYSCQPTGFIKAIHRRGTLCLMPAFLKEYLGNEEKLIRREWLKRGFTTESERAGKIVDYQLIKHSGNSFRAVPINKEFIDEMGLDFNEREFR